MMRKPLSNKMRLVRPADAFLPIAFLAACLFGEYNDVITGFFCYLNLKLLALASSDGLRIAFAYQPSIRRVRGSVKTAILLQIVSTILVCTAVLLIDGAPAYPTVYVALATGLFLNIEQIFYEYLCATNDGFSALTCRIITSILLFAGYALKRYWVQIATVGCAALISVIIGLLIGGGLKGKWSVQPIKSAPRALLQSIIYPWPMLVFLFFFFNKETSVANSPFTIREPLDFAPFFAGLAFYSLFRTPFRRTYSEAKGMNIALSAVILLCAAVFLCTMLPALPIREMLGDTATVLSTCALCIGYAALCALILYGNFRKTKD